MATVLLVVHLFIALALVGVVLMQRSEGGALGIGGGGGGFLSGRGTANLLTRTTALLAAAFFCTSIVLTILAQRTTAPGSAFDQPGAAAPATSGQPAAPTDGATPAPAGRGGVLDALQQGKGGERLPAVPGAK